MLEEKVGKRRRCKEERMLEEKVDREAIRRRECLRRR